MKTKGVGIALILIGIVMTIYTGFNYVTTEKLVDIGPIQINHEKNHPVQWAPILGIIVLAAGAFLVVKDSINKD